MDPCLQFYHLLKHVTCNTEHEISKALKDSSITLQQAMILLHIEEGARTMSELSDAMCCSHGNVTQLTEHLLAKKLITQFPCKEDRRVQHVKLTASGSKILITIAESLEKRAHACLKNLDPSERKKVTVLLEQCL
jgi:DNA-binding MarR family transcriptional regulator